MRFEQAVEIFHEEHGWLEAQVHDIDGRTVTCVFEVHGMVGFREIEDSQVSMMRPLGRRPARGTLTASTSNSPSSIYSDRGDVAYETAKYSGQLQPEPEPELEPELGFTTNLTPVKQRDSLADAVARIEQEGREFQELALSYLVSGSVLSDTGSGGGGTPRLARLAEQYTPRDGEHAPSLSDPLVEARFDVGDPVWIYSSSANHWIAGEVESIHVGASATRSTDERCTIVRVMYWAGNAKRGKDVDASDRGLIRPFGSRPPGPPGE